MHSSVSWLSSVVLTTAIACKSSYSGSRVLEDVGAERKNEVLQVWELPKSGYHNEVMDYLSHGAFVWSESPREGIPTLSVYDIAANTPKAKIEFERTVRIEPFYIDGTRIGVLINSAVSSASTPSPQLAIYHFPSLKLLRKISLPKVDVSRSVYLKGMDSIAIKGWKDVVLVGANGEVRKHIKADANFGFQIEADKNLAMWSEYSQDKGLNTVKVVNLIDGKAVGSANFAGKGYIGSFIDNTTLVVSMISENSKTDCLIHDYVTGKHLKHLDYSCSGNYFPATYNSTRSPEIIRVSRLNSHETQSEKVVVEFVDPKNGKIRRSFPFEKSISAAHYFSNDQFFLIVTADSVYVYDTVMWDVVYQNRIIEDRYVRIKFIDSGDKLVLSKIGSGRIGILDMKQITSSGKK